MRKWIYEPRGDRIEGDHISGWIYLYLDNGVRVYVGGVASCPGHTRGDEMGQFLVAAANAAEGARTPGVS